MQQCAAAKREKLSACCKQDGMACPMTQWCCPECVTHNTPLWGKAHLVPFFFTKKNVCTQMTMIEEDEDR